MKKQDLRAGAEALVKGAPLQERYDTYEEIIREYVMMDDTFMRAVLKDPDCVEYLLQVILQQKDLKVQEVVLQRDYKNLHGRSLILDCVATDQKGHLYNIEIQKEAGGAFPERARYHSSLMDMHMLQPGQKFTELKNCQIIFLTNGTVKGCKRPVFHVKRMIEEEQKVFGDGSGIIVVNAKAAGEADTKLGRLLHDLNCKHADEMYSEVLAKRVRELKETKKGVQSMCETLDQLCQEAIQLGKDQWIELGKSQGIELGKSQGIELGKSQGIELGKSQGIELGKSQGIELGKSQGIELGKKRGKKEGKKLGAMKAKRETALSLYEMGLEVEKIAQAVGLKTSLVKKWLGMEVTKSKL